MRIRLFQMRVVGWLETAFSVSLIMNHRQRNQRFLEEALELVQSLDLTRAEAHVLVDYVFDRPAGKPTQEVGGTMVTLAALCHAHHIDLEVATRDEVKRIWNKIDEIRAKQAGKPRVVNDGEHDA